MNTNQERLLVCRIGSRFCALPIEHIAETMRPLPVEPLSGMPSFVMGLSTIRGWPIPVVDAGRLLGIAKTKSPARFVTLKLGERAVALAVDEVIGVRDIPWASRGGLPPLLGEANADVVAAIGTLDADLMLVLTGANLIPDTVWEAISRKETVQ